jgi:hypothetical protein
MDIIEKIDFTEFEGFLDYTLSFENEVFDDLVESQGTSFKAMAVYFKAATEAAMEVEVTLQEAEEILRTSNELFPEKMEKISGKFRDAVKRRTAERTIRLHLLTGNSAVRSEF